MAGRTLVHLQCHFGLDTLSWARHGARVTGLDFSAPAVEAARELAGELGVEADFVCADVYDAPEALGGRRFDIAYVNVGAINWLPDIGRWAEVVRGVLAPGGVLYMKEVHPFSWVFGERDLTVESDYFAHRNDYDEPGTYADPDAQTVHNRHGGVAAPARRGRERADRRGPDARAPARARPCRLSGSGRSCARTARSTGCPREPRGCRSCTRCAHGLRSLVQMPEGDTIHSAARRIRRGARRQRDRGDRDAAAPPRARPLARAARRPRGARGGRPRQAPLHPLRRRAHAPLAPAHGAAAGASTGAASAGGARPRRAWLVLRTREHEVVQFDGPVLELMTDSRTRFDQRIGALGPDLLADDFDERRFLRRLREDDQTPRHRRRPARPAQPRRASGTCGSPRAASSPESTPGGGSARRERRRGRSRSSRGLRPLMQRSAEGGGRDERWVFERTGLPCRRCGALDPRARPGRRQPHDLLVPVVPGSCTLRVGHKGADHVAPGNTLESFEAALEHGVDMIEFDVLRGRDGRLVLAHDYEDAEGRELPDARRGSRPLRGRGLQRTSSSTWT